MKGQQRTRRRIWFVGVAAALLIAAAAATAAFGGGAGHATSATQSADTKTLVVAVPSDIQNLDPTLSSADVVTQELLTNVYDWLIDYKVVTQGGHQIGSPNQFVGAIAKSFSWNKSHTVVTFHLREGVKFANGDPLDADAVKFTYDRIFKQKGVTAALTAMAAVKSGSAVKVVNPTTVSFDLTKANNLLFGNMAQFGHSILDPKVVQPHVTSADPYAHNWLGSNIDGTAQGPFQLESWQHGSQWVLTKNPNYYGQKPKVDKVIFKIIPNASSRLALLKSGAVDIAYDLPLKDIKALQGSSSVQVIRYPSRFVVFLGMNSKVKPFNNVKVRQAISYATPYKTIISQVLQGYGRQLTSPIPFGTPTHTDKYFVYKTDYVKAKQLLAQAGYPNGFTTTLNVASGVDEGTETAVWVQQSLKKIGIKVQIQQLPGANFTSRLQKHQLGFFFFNNWISINNDPFYHLFWLFRSDCCDYTNYSNKTVWKAIDSNLLSNNPTKRAAAANATQKQIMQDAPWVFLYQPDFVIAMRKNVHGYVYYSSDRFTRYKFLSKTAS
ncbi:MAG: ABC transporter substrate-binding protein [Actinobacteria bacterium]|nr:MAG: ABC transporter substrate-binding protein [Actinomycetota bacterium]